jgi:hypothetical protein
MLRFQKIACSETAHSPSSLEEVVVDVSGTFPLQLQQQGNIWSSGLMPDYLID